MEAVIAPSISGFGDYSENRGETDLERAARVHRLALYLLFSSSAVCVGAAVIFVASLTIVSAAAMAIALAFFASAVVNRISAGQIVSRVNRHIAGAERSNLLSEYSCSYRGRASIEVCATPEETFAKVLQLLKAAQSSVTIANTYSGGRAFDEVLDVLATKLEAIPTFRVALLTSKMFITDDNRTRLHQLRDLYSDRFVYTFAESHLRREERWKLVNSHVKAIAIDGGRYCVVGGTGLEDQYLRRADRAPPNLIKRLFLSDRFQDMDMIFTDHGEGFGRSLYLELLKLVSIWRHHHGEEDPNSHLRSGAVDRYFSVPLPAANIADVELLLTCPEHSTNSFYDQFIAAVDAAEESVYISHLYFHLPEEPLRRLADALERGVSVVLCTNSMHSTAPITHAVFSDRTSLNLRRLAKMVSPENRRNLRVYFFEERGATLHKKVVVFDREHVLIGSSNLGTKSMVTGSDYELTASVHSSAIGHKTVSVIEEHDIPCCRLEPTEQLAASEGLGTVVFGNVEEWMGQLIG